jgi:hypothetical protein
MCAALLFRAVDRSPIRPVDEPDLSDRVSILSSWVIPERP